MECSSIMVSYKKLKKTREREKGKRKTGCVCMPGTDSKKMYRLCKEQGIYYVDCPVSGGPAGAADSSLSVGTVMVPLSLPLTWTAISTVAATVLEAS